MSGEKPQHRTRPPPSIKGEGEEEEEEDPYVTQLADCSQVYLQLETCLGEHDRDWTKCQDLVKKLQACSQLNQKQQG